MWLCYYYWLVQILTLTVTVTVTVTVHGLLVLRRKTRSPVCSSALQNQETQNWSSSFYWLALPLVVGMYLLPSRMDTQRLSKSSKLLLLVSNKHHLVRRISVHYWNRPQYG